MGPARIPDPPVPTKLAPPRLWELSPRPAARTDRRFLVNQAAVLTIVQAPGQIWKARIADISRRGMQLVVDQPLTAGPEVRIEWRGHDLHGTIRYQKQRGAEYRIGVELASCWESLVNEVLACQSEELNRSNMALEQQAEVLAHALAAAREASRVKSRFLASVSHELRTPLNGIIGLSQLLHDEIVGGLAADQKECLGDILNCSNHLLTLINQVLDLTKVESGKMDFEYENVDLEDLVSTTIDSIRAIAAGKHIDVQFQCDPTLGMVEADPARLKQVVFNYLSNALKFTDDRGWVRVSVSVEDDSCYRIQVEDNGVGIRSEDLPRLFTEFGQLCASEKAQAGTGLGLAITKRIIEAQGGRVGVESEPEKGSRFYAILPLRRVHANSRPQAAAGSGPQG
jgi:signal transduction histidine kinase